MSAQSATPPDHRPPRPGPSFFAPDLQVTGRIVSTGDLEIEGEVDGIVDATRLKVGPHGRLRATIEADDAVVSGNVAGIIKARGVTFTDGCRFTGEVQYEQLGMEPEASVEGRLIPVVEGNARSHVGQTTRTAPALVSDQPPASGKVGSGKVGPGKVGRAKPRPVPRIPRHAAAVEPTPPRRHPWLTAAMVTVVLIASAVVGALYISPAARDWRSAMVEAVRDGKPAASAPAARVDADAPPAVGPGVEPVADDPAAAPSPAPSPATEPLQPRDAAPPPKPAAPAEPVAPTPPAVRAVAPAEPAPQPEPARPAKSDVPSAPVPPAEPVKAPAAGPAADPPPRPAPQNKAPENKVPEVKAPEIKAPESRPVPPRAIEPAAPAKVPAPAKTAPVKPAPVATPAVAAPPVSEREAQAPKPAAEPPAAPAPQDVAPVPNTKPPAAAKPAAESSGGTSSGRGAKPEEEGCQWVKQCDPDQPDRCVSVRRCGE